MRKKHFKSIFEPKPGIKAISFIKYKLKASYEKRKNHLLLRAFYKIKEVVDYVSSTSFGILFMIFLVVIFVALLIISKAWVLGYHRAEIENNLVITDQTCELNILKWWGNVANYNFLTLSFMFLYIWQSIIRNYRVRKPQVILKT